MIESVILPGGSALDTVGNNVSAIDSGQLCHQAGITTPEWQMRVKNQARRFRVYGLVMLTIQVLITVALLVIFFRVLQFFVWPYIRIILQSYVSTDLFAIVMFSLLWVILYLVFFKITGNLATVVVNGYFAESICVVALLNLIIDLDKSEPLTPARKKNLLRRTDHLAQSTRLLYTLYFKYNERNRVWLARHFSEMEAYILERGRWLIAPESSTLPVLRRDFKNLAPIYITGNYGDFTWANLVEVKKQEKGNLGQRISRGLLRFFGMILPLTLMGLYLWRPELFPSIKLDPDVVTLIFLAWLLLSIDATLNLGVVAGVTNLAKGIKDLKT